MNAAVFVDFENLYLALKALGEADGGRTRRERALSILDGMLRKLRDSGHTMMLGRSYTAFDTFPGSEVAHDLALLGLDPQYVLVGHSGGNSAEVQLTLDVARVLYRRGDIEMIVVVCGDRDFLPLAREVLEEGRELRMVAIAAAISGDLRERVGEQRFIDAIELDVVREPLGVPRPRTHVHATASSTPVETVVDQEQEEPPPERLSPSRSTTEGGVAVATSPAAVVVGHIPVTWDSPPNPENQESMLVHCLELMLRSRMRHDAKEVWLSPFLKGPMSQHFAHVVHPERRAMINELRNRGAIRVEERENKYAEHPYSVIVIDDDHAMTHAAWQRYRAAAERG